ncbi:MAG: hypothetical protein PHD97_06740 [Bacteroidales bacterium]|nr:hypothetical protein [Bacteroidales bacterium]
MKLISKIALFVLIAISAVLYLSCKKKSPYPSTPAIELRSFEKIPNGTSIDDKGYLTISFTDGDGDLGLDSYDTNPPFDKSSSNYFNYFIRFKEKQNGNFVDITDSLPMTLNARFPRIESKTKNKSLKGYIELEIFINNYESPFDTVEFDVYIMDRALHKSNVISTPEIVINK